MKKKAKGFTLVEVIMSMMIFSMVLLMAASLFMTSMMLQKKSKEVTAKQTKMSNEIENGGDFEAAPFEIKFEGTSLSIGK